VTVTLYGRLCSDSCAHFRSVSSLPILRHPRSTLFPYTTLFRSQTGKSREEKHNNGSVDSGLSKFTNHRISGTGTRTAQQSNQRRSEEHTSELQSRFDLVCRLLLEKKKHIPRS